MKKIFLIALLSICTVQFLHAQDNTKTRAATPDEQKKILDDLDTTKMLKEFAAKACKCIDSISVADKGQKEISQEVKQCIDKQVTIYETSVKLFSSLKNTGKSNTIYLDVDPGSDEYKKYYYDLERWLLDNCTSLKNAVRAENIKRDFSVSDNPKAMSQYNKGVDLVGKENYKDGLPYFKKAVEIDPNFAFAWDNLGLCYRKTGDYDKALEAYQKSLEVDPKGQMPLQNIPIVYEFEKDYDKELEAYQNMLNVYPDDPEGYFGMGKIYAFYKNDMEKGLDDLCKAYNLYVKESSPYRSDAEKLINYLYPEMKKQGKEDAFNKILKDNNITPDKH